MEAESHDGRYHERRAGRVLPLALGIVILLSAPWVAMAASVENGGFETEDTTSWEAVPASGGSVEVVPAYVQNYPSYVYTPPEGSWFALLQPGEAGVSTRLAQTFEAQAGQAISCRSFFDAADSDYNDSADVRILSGGAAVATVFHADVTSSTSLTSTGWSVWQYVFANSGSYTIEAGVMNEGDNFMPSDLGLDGCVVGSPTTVTDFAAAATGDGRVTLSWQTIAEMNSSGFNLLRAVAAEGPYARVNMDPIPAQGSVQAGSTYNFVDMPGSGTFYYRLDALSVSGGTVSQGPVQVEASSPFRRPPRRPQPPES